MPRGSDMPHTDPIIRTEIGSLRRDARCRESARGDQSPKDQTLQAGDRNQCHRRAIVLFVDCWSSLGERFGDSVTWYHTPWQSVPWQKSLMFPPPPHPPPPPLPACHSRRKSLPPRPRCHMPILLFLSACLPCPLSCLP